MKIFIPDRFMVKIDKTPDCWNWIACLSREGYGRYSFGKKVVFAHRQSYEYFVGDIPEGLVLDHLCRNPACVNPDHLEPVTHYENWHRGLRGKLGKLPRAITHCINGHEYSEENTYYRNNGTKECRKCRYNQDRKRKQRISAI